MNTPNVIESILASPEFLSLRKKVVEIPKREDGSVRRILILESCGLTNARMGRIDREVKSTPSLADFIDPMEQFGSARLYTDMACISFGDVPTLFEFLAMPNEDITLWLREAMTVNPKDFEWITQMTKAIETADRQFFAELGNDIPAVKEDERKKKRTRRKSGNG